MPKFTVIHESDSAHRDRRIVSHPAALSAQVGNVHIGASGMYAFGSELSHNQMVRLSFSPAELHIDDHLQYESLYPKGQTYFEVYFTPAQWASLLCSFGVGSGVACTMTRKAGPNFTYQELIVDEPYTMSAKDFLINVEKKSVETEEKFKTLVEELQAMAEDKGTVSKPELRKKVAKLSAYIGVLRDSMAFDRDQFVEFMDDKVAVAKSEVEAFHQSKLQSIALQALAAKGNTEEEIINALTEENQQ